MSAAPQPVDPHTRDQAMTVVLARAKSASKAAGLDLRNLAKVKVAHKGLLADAEYAMRNRMEKLARWQEKRAVASRYEAASSDVGTYLRDAGLESLGAFIGKAILMFCHNANERLFIERVLDFNPSQRKGPEWTRSMAQAVSICAAALGRAPAWIHGAVFRYASGSFSTHLNSECASAGDDAGTCFVENLKRFTKGDSAQRPDNAATLARVFGMFKVIHSDSLHTENNYDAIDELKRDYDLYTYYHDKLWKGWPRSKKTGHTWLSWNKRMAREVKDAQAKMRVDGEARKAPLPVQENHQKKLARLRAMVPPAIPHPVPELIF